jgi:glycosyltransferase involved in cell wall biosynthesis
VTVVIPAVNEEENLRFVMPLLPTVVDEVVLVDGGSVDATVQTVMDGHPNVTVVHQGGRGKGDALKIGFAAATGDIIVTLDADGSADPSEIPRFVDALEGGALFAKGSRFIAGGGSHDITRLRRAGNLALTKVVNALFRTRYTDLCYGYNAFWRSCLPVLAVDTDGFEVETQMNIRLALAKVPVVEVASFEHARICGDSHLKAFRDGVRVLRTILKERFSRAHRRRLVAVPKSTSTP